MPGNPCVQVSRRSRDPTIGRCQAHTWRPFHLHPQEQVVVVVAGWRLVAVVQLDVAEHGLLFGVGVHVLHRGWRQPAARLRIGNHAQQLCANLLPREPLDGAAQREAGLPACRVDAEPLGKRVHRRRRVASAHLRCAQAEPRLVPLRLQVTGTERVRCSCRVLAHLGQSQGPVAEQSRVAFSARVQVQALRVPDPYAGAVSTVKQRRARCREAHLCTAAPKLPWRTASSA